MAKVERKETAVYKIELTKEEYILLRQTLSYCRNITNSPEKESAIDDLIQTFQEAWID